MENSNSYAKINVENLKHNYRELKKVTGNKEVICIVKADAYGHGAVICSNVLQEAGAKYFAVASIDEAEELRLNGIEQNILILGYIPVERISEIFKYKLIACIYSMPFAESLNEYAVKNNLTADVHIKINTGMNRLGFTGKNTAIEHILNIEKMQGLNIAGIFTHYATADEADLTYTKMQLDKFTEIIKELEKLNIKPDMIHVSNSAAILNFDSPIGNAVRPGFALYGLCSADEMNGADLKPVMSFCSQVANTHALHKGETTSYGRKYTAENERRIATISAGYADGYFRLLSNKAEVFINGKRAKVLGTICMDMFMVDITDIDDVKVGDEVELFGCNIPAKELADIVGTIAYEVTCAISKRVKRVIV